MKQLLFLCTGNYYRSRFAEYYFRDRASRMGLAWSVDSRALNPSPDNVGPLSHHTQVECKRLGISTEPLRDPILLTAADLERSDLTIAVKELEHRALMRSKFPDWEERIEYWQVHDLDCAGPEVALPELRTLVDALILRIAGQCAAAR